MCSEESIEAYFVLACMYQFRRPDGRMASDAITQTKISRIDRLPYFCTHGAPLACLQRSKLREYFIIPVWPNQAFYLFIPGNACTWGPQNFVEGHTEKLECDFEAPVGKVYWYKDNKLLTNGTNGLYQSHGQITRDTVRSILNFLAVRMEHEGIYNCRADTSQNSSCPNGLTIEVDVLCKYWVLFICTPRQPQLHVSTFLCSRA